MDNAYENFIPKILIVRVVNVDEYKDTNIKQSYNKKTGKSTFTVTPKFNVNNQKRSLHTTTSIKPSLVTKAVKRATIAPFKVNENAKLKPFSTLDIETINHNNKEYPVAISLAVGYQSKPKPEIYFLSIDKQRLKYNEGILDTASLESEVLKMWKALSRLLSSIANELVKGVEVDEKGRLKEKPILYTYAHNMGAFDGYYIFKYFTNFFDNKNINTIIDKQNKFITITFVVKVTGIQIRFLDSYRLFPVSLDSLYKVFLEEVKFMKYDKDKFHNISLFHTKDTFNLFKEYSIQDSKSLWEALLQAQAQYWDDYTVDITSIVSASSLAFKIFRTKYLKQSIQIPLPEEDRYVRESYFGGATDVYKAFGKLLHYIDVNSLYPFAILHRIPFNIKGFIKDMSNVDLNKFFGFVKVEVTCPDTVTRPILPVKHQGKTIYPRGKWVGTYFSEEIKAVLSKDLGYEFKLISGYEFTYKYLFKNYVKDIYKIKQYSIGPERFIAKLLLNTLYGTFGRRQDTTEVIIINNNEEKLYLTTHIILNSIPLDNDRSALIIQNNIQLDVLLKLNATFETDYQTPHVSVNSNIAIASAVTSYARIHMMDIKLHESCYYTDTESAFFDDLEPFKHLLGDELGMFKDELNGSVIEEAEFVGIKQYGYWYYDKEGNKVEKSVFAGVTRDSLSFESIQKIQKGEVLKLEAPDRFFRSLQALNISIRALDLEIRKNNPKLLHDNFYYPNVINNEIRDTNKEISLLKLGHLINKNLRARIKKLKMKIEKKNTN